jgi:hypothetical protein
MSNPVTTPLWNKRIRRGSFAQRAPRVTGTLTWTWSGIITPASYVNWPVRYPLSDGTLLSMNATVLTPDITMLNSGPYFYTVDLFSNGTPVASVLWNYNTVGASTSVFSVAGVNETIPVYPRIAPMPWGGAYDLTITLTYEHAPVA